MMLPVFVGKLYSFSPLKTTGVGITRLTRKTNTGLENRQGRDGLGRMVGFCAIRPTLSQCGAILRASRQWALRFPHAAA